ncbi:MAG: hypothetical protein CM1200mP25_2190 [Acidobacteriota bacterium]|nr:MAG: hypothetical protein CM1200mP25_2190 [Acidobacteriota bacterium]
MTPRFPGVQNRAFVVKFNRLLGFELIDEHASGCADDVGRSDDFGVKSFQFLRRGTPVVILPFTNISGAPADDWLSVGIAESIRVDVRQLPALFL